MNPAGVATRGSGCCKYGVPGVGNFAVPGCTVVTQQAVLSETTGVLTRGGFRR